MRSIAAFTIGQPLMNAGGRAIIALLIGVAALIAGSGLCQAQTPPVLPDKCPPTGILPPGTGQNLLVDSKCRVGGGIYHYNNVNIVNGGQLLFTEGGTMNLKIHFWASSILIEYGGSLVAGSPGSLGPPVVPPAPFGVNGGTLTIHLYGADNGVGASGITCKSNNGATDPPCGIPPDVWANACAMQTPPGPCNPIVLPGGSGPPPPPPPAVAPLWPTYTDNFYKYETLPFDDGNPQGFFGYKVLAVSEGGSLQLFGAKGATYGAELDPHNSGTSWTRLNGTINGPVGEAAGATNLALATPVDWKAGDHIVVTSTDYLPDHSEELVICTITGGTAVQFTTNLAWTPTTGPCPAQGVRWTHNGVTFDLTAVPARVNLHTAPPTLTDPVNNGPQKTKAETRAAVGLLTRSIRIVSEGDKLGQCFPPTTMTDTGSGCEGTDPRTNYFFGGHTIVRQGFAAFQVQGVEFRQLGQGGRLSHYPVHFHMDRKAAPNTFIKDSSINESMTRWITVHGTQEVLVERNVGYLSIGHGFYLEDAVETDNQFYSNLGIFARAAVVNASNPREVPGILAATPIMPPAGGVAALDTAIGLSSDRDKPAVFWMTHGWNDFIGNMAAGAGMCGVCFWEAPTSICGISRKETWTSYASEQTLAGGRTGSSPLKNFDGNYCSSAMTSFQTVGDTEACHGVVLPGTAMMGTVAAVANPLAPPANATSTPPPVQPVPPIPVCGGGPGSQYPICPNDYYPLVDGGQLAHATKCPPAPAVCDNTVPLCSTGNAANCVVSVINNYTSSFHWAPFNFAAVWLRTRWHLVANSFISDTQNAGLTFVSGGDYTHSSAIPGLWELALQNAFVGQTQASDAAHAFASALSPFNTTSGLTCDNVAPLDGGYCLSRRNSISLAKSNFGVSQHMFNIYDGPASEDSNAFLRIKKIALGVNSDQSSFVYRQSLGIPRAAFTEGSVNAGQCYMQNAAIAWKQPNGFYYPPNFRSQNLFFDNVDIRHYVIVPQFTGNTYQTNAPQVATAYCKQAPNMFNNFSAVDRQTELTDDDGSLTGYAHTTSVNEDLFFKAPIEGPECQSDLSTPPLLPNKAPPSPGTAKTSPYSYVTTVVYPDSATATGRSGDCGDTDWNSRCTNQNCFGVPFYRVYQTGTERNAKAPLQAIRMSGFNICQRQTMTANHGIYYVDLTASSATQKAWVANFNFCPAPEPIPPPPPNKPPPLPADCIDHNLFKAGKAYDFFHVYATKDTEQTFQMFVGPKEPVVKLIRVNIATAPFGVSEDNTHLCNDTSTTCNVQYKSPILTVKLNVSAFAPSFADALAKHCAPSSFCTLVGTTCKRNPNAAPISNLTNIDQDRTCAHAIDDVDCPTGGCIGFKVTLQDGFTANDQTTPSLLGPLATCFPKDANWNVTPLAALSPLAGSCFPQQTHAPLTADFCSQ